MDLLNALKDRRSYKYFIEDYPHITLTHPYMWTYMRIKQAIEQLEAAVKDLGNSIVKHNNHYESCPWSNVNNTEGPDTCLCSLLCFREYEITQLLNELYGDETD